MEIRIDKLQLEDLTTSQCRKLFPLTLARGVLRLFLKDVPRLQNLLGMTPTYVYIAYTDTTSNPKGWAVCRHYTRRKACIELFVTPRSRRKGIGTALVNAAKEDTYKNCKWLNAACSSTGLKFFRKLDLYGGY